MFFANVRLMNAGVRVTKTGRRQLDRHKKRQMNYFQIVWRFWQKRLVCELSLPCGYK